MKKIIVDIYGADMGPQVAVEGTLAAMEISKDFNVCFAGSEAETKDILKKTVGKYDFDEKRVSFLDAPLQITNNEVPTRVIKGGDGTSLTEALKMLRASEDVVGMVSCGNTGAILIGSIFILGLQKGLKRPALASLLPTRDGKLLCLLDCGSNIDCNSDELVIFAKLGCELMNESYGVDNPKVGLLSVGKEQHKGNALTHEAYEKLMNSEMNFKGNVEPDSLYTDDADVIVCDGFPGNIMLKNTEATGKNILSRIERIEKDEKDVHTLEVIGKIKEEIIKSHDFNSKGGALFLGTTKKIVKGHGSADKSTICSCILQLLGENQFFSFDRK